MIKISTLPNKRGVRVERCVTTVPTKEQEEEEEEEDSDASLSSGEWREYEKSTVVAKELAEGDERQQKRAAAKRQRPRSPLFLTPHVMEVYCEKLGEHLMTVEVELSLRSSSCSAEFTETVKRLRTEYETHLRDWVHTLIQNGGGDAKKNKKQHSEELERAFESMRAMFTRLDALLLTVT